MLIDRLHPYNEGERERGGGEGERERGREREGEREREIEREREREMKHYNTVVHQIHCTLNQDDPEGLLLSSVELQTK
jgi:hypothetical protein